MTRNRPARGKSPAASRPPMQAPPRGPPSINRSGAGRRFSAPTPVACSQSRGVEHPSPIRPCGTQEHFRIGSVAPTHTSIVLVAPGTRTGLALWHPGPERAWPCGTRDQNGPGLVAPGTRTDQNWPGLVALKAVTRCSCGARGQNPHRSVRRRRVDWPVSSGAQRGTMTLGRPGISPEVAIACVTPTTQGAFRRCRLVCQLWRQ